MKNKSILVLVAAIIILVVGVYLVLNHKVQLGAATNMSNISAATANIGSGCDSSFTTCTGLAIDSTGSLTTTGTLSIGAITASSTTITGALSTTTPASMTMKASDISTGNIVMTPTVGSITVTLPATSTLSTFIPTTGNSFQLVFLNATTTASQNITVAGGTGMNVTVASSTTSQITIKPKNSWIITFIRQPNTDISVFASGAAI